MQILLNLGRIEDAVEAARDACELRTWDKRQAVRGGLAYIFGIAAMPAGWCFFNRFDAGAWFAVVNDQVTYEFGMHASLYEFANAVDHLKRPAFRRFNVENWRASERLR